MAGGHDDERRLTLTASDTNAEEQCVLDTRKTPEKRVREVRGQKVGEKVNTAGAISRPTRSASDTNASASASIRCVQVGGIPK